MPVQNLNGPLGPHHRDLSRRPGQGYVVAHGLGVHDDVCAAVRLAGGDVDPRDGGSGVGEGQLRAVTDHPTPFEVLAGVEARSVDERQQRQVEGVAEGDEAGALARSGDVESPGDAPGLVRHDADRSPAHRGEPGDQVGRPQGVQLEQVAVVDDATDDVAAVVGAVGRIGEHPIGLGRRSGDRIRARSDRRSGVGVVGQEPQDVGDDRLGLSGVLGDERGDSGGSLVDVGPAEFGAVDPDAGELPHHRRPRDEGVGVAHHDDDVGESEHERRAGDGGAAHDHDRRDHSRTTRELARRCTPGVESRHALGQVGAARGQPHQQRQALLTAVAGGRGDGLPVGAGQRPCELPALRVDFDDAPTGEADRANPHEAAGAGTNVDGTFRWAVHAGLFMLGCSFWAVHAGLFRQCRLLGAARASTRPDQRRSRRRRCG